MKVSDGRRPPFTWLSNDAVRLLQGGLSGKELNTVLGVYTAFAYLASTRRDGDHEGFEATRTELATAAGVTTPTLDRYVHLLEDAGLLCVAHQRIEKDGKVWHRPNKWVLQDPQRGGAVGLPTPPRGSAIEQGEGTPVEKGEGYPDPIAPILQEEKKENRRNPPGSPLKLVDEPATHDKRVPAEVSGLKVERVEHDMVDAILAAINEKTGARFTALEFRQKIVLRMREHPELDLERHLSIIDAVFANPWWKDRPTPSVVYGNSAVFERGLAQDGKGPTERDKWGRVKRDRSQLGRAR